MDDRIKEVMAKAFNVTTDQISDNTSQDNLEDWDSIHHIQMIVLIEREFDITIPDDVVGKMISFNLIKSVVQKCYETRI